MPAPCRFSQAPRQDAALLIAGPDATHVCSPQALPDVVSGRRPPGPDLGSPAPSNCRQTPRPDIEGGTPPFTIDDPPIAPEVWTLRGNPRVRGADSSFEEAPRPQKGLPQLVVYRVINNMFQVLPKLHGCAITKISGFKQFIYMYRIRI
jgi:hypothetical protein